MENSILPIQRLYGLLTQEYENEKEEYRVETSKMSVGRKVKRGICWYPVVACRSYYNSLNQLVVEIKQTSPQDIDHHFEYGKPVVFFTTSNADQDGDSVKPTYLPHPCTISYVDGDRMVVVVPSSQFILDLQRCTTLGVQLYLTKQATVACFMH